MKKIVCILFILIVISGCKGSIADEMLHSDLDKDNNKTTLKEQNEKNEEETNSINEFKTITFNGSGDDVVEFDLQDNAYYLIHVVGNAESRHFALKAYDESGRYDLLINTTDEYNGKVFDKSFNKNTLVVDAKGEWAIEVLDLFKASTSIGQGETVEGKGDDVLLVTSYGKTFTFKHYGEHHVAVKVFDNRMSYDLAVNDSGNYEGKLLLGKNPTIITVEADGEWEITLN